MTWFRREPSAEWVRGFGDDAAIARDVLVRIAEFLTIPS